MTFPTSVSIAWARSAKASGASLPGDSGAVMGCGAAEASMGPPVAEQGAGETGVGPAVYFLGSSELK